MRGYYRRRARYAHRSHSFNGLIWLVGLAILFYTGHWWPGILILIGISTLLSAAWQSDDPQPEPEVDQQAPATSRPVIIDLPPASPAPTPPVNAAHTDLLPAASPRCGAPVRSAEVKWTGLHSAACAYCGSNLVAAKN